MQIRKKELNFLSADGKSTISALYFYDVDVVKIAILQIAHGMCEYKERYLPFIEFMAQKGYVVCISDHLGHGHSSAPADYGFFAEEHGADDVLADMVTLNRTVHDIFPRLDIYLLGHSMGSFFARWFAAEHGDLIKGAIFMGTGGPNPMTPVGLKLTSLVKKLRGGHYRSKFINNMAFGGYNKSIKNPLTQYDWLSRDEKSVAAYAADPACTFIFTVSGYHDMLTVLQKVSTPEWAQSLPKDLPVLLVAGAADPVGNFGEGVRQVYEMVKEAGVKNVELKLYDGMRHEILNETGKEAVFEDLNHWLTTLADPDMPCVCTNRHIRKSQRCAHCSFFFKR